MRDQRLWLGRITPLDPLTERPVNIVVELGSKAWSDPLGQLTKRPMSLVGDTDFVISPLGNF